MPGEQGLIGAAGEYLVAAELSRRGWLATVTIKNAPGTDVLAQHSATKQVVAIQTKTATTATFRLSARDEVPASAPNQWFLLVALGNQAERPRFFVIPHDVVSSMLYIDNAQWLSRPGRGGVSHKPTAIRAIRSKSVEGYRERWDLLEAPTTKAPFLLDEAWVTWARKLPPNYWRDSHPGFPEIGPPL